jgi:prevent-host-death family protein
MRKVGSRELKNRFGWYLRAVRRGQSLLVTVRGKPAARILPPIESTSQEDDLGSVLKALEAQGHIRLAKGKLGKFRAVKIKGKPISETIIEDRQ